MRQAWFLNFRGDETEMPLYDRPQMQEILAIADLVERTRAHAAFVTANNRRSSPLLRAMEGAAASEPGAADMLAEWAQRRLDVATKYAHAAAETGQLAVTEHECRDILYATMDGALLAAPRRATRLVGPAIRHLAHRGLAGDVRPERPELTTAAHIRCARLGT